MKEQRSKWLILGPPPGKSSYGLVRYDYSEEDPRDGRVADDAHIGEDLEAIRAMMRQRGLVRRAPSPTADPQVIEFWLEPE